MKLTDLIADIDDRLEAKQQRIQKVEDNARKAREKKERQRQQDNEERLAAQRRRQREHYQRKRAKEAEEKGKKGVALTVEERILLAEQPDLADISKAQREFVLRLRQYHASVEIHHPTDRRDRSIALVVTTQRGRQRFHRVTYNGNGDTFLSLEEALSSRVTEAREQRVATIRREHLADALLTLHDPPQHLRPHAWRGEYEPDFVPTESICSDWRIAASRDPAEGTWTPNLAAAQATVLLRQLPERERMVIAMRFGVGGQRPQTLDQVGQHFGLTRERVRQLESLAIKKMRQLAEGEEPDPSPSARPSVRSNAFVLTDEQLALVLAAREKGYMQKQVATALGITVAKFATALKRAGHSWRDG